MAAVWAVLALTASAAAQTDITFNISLLGQSNPKNIMSGFHYGDVWAEGNYAYVGSDRGGGGVTIYDISNPFSPQYISEYAGSELEDAVVINGIGYFGSDVNNSTPATGTGVDIVDLSNPYSPTRMSRIDASLGGHHKVHTLSVDAGFLYTTDNATNVVKVFDVSNPYAPQFKWNISLGLPSNMASHEVVAQDGRLYVATKNNSDSVNGWTHIYDVSNVGASQPALMKAFNTGGGTHTSMPSPDGNYLVVTQERSNGQLRIYDISMIDQHNDPDAPVLLTTMTRSSLGIQAHSPHHSHWHGDVLFVSWYEAGILTFNVADPANPIWTGAFDTYPGTSSNYNGAWGIFPLLGHEKVLISDRTRGLLIVDATLASPSADFDQNGTVDGADLLRWQRGLGTTNGAPHVLGDANRDGTVNNLDLDVWQIQFGGPGHHYAFGAIGAVPEPLTGRLLAAAIASLAVTARRGRR
ncbi:MAG TPA: hypothetical protein PKC18_20720 [Lacipirellulaceae bacterium]|nr:hypothetical protein [Lacipirellulaceae bacterium]